MLQLVAFKMMLLKLKSNFNNQLSQRPFPDGISHNPAWRILKVPFQS